MRSPQLQDQQDPQVRILEGYMHQKISSAQHGNEGYMHQISSAQHGNEGYMHQIISSAQHGNTYSRIING